MRRRVSRGEREALVILVGVGFFLGGRVAMVAAWLAWPSHHPGPTGQVSRTLGQRRRRGGRPGRGWGGVPGLVGLAGGSPGRVWGVVHSGVEWGHGGWPGGGPAPPPPLAEGGPAPPEATVVFPRQLGGT